MNLDRGISDSQEHPDTSWLFFSILLGWKSLSLKPWKESPAAFNTKLAAASDQHNNAKTWLVVFWFGFFFRLLLRAKPISAILVNQKKPKLQLWLEGGAEKRWWTANSEVLGDVPRWNPRGQFYVPAVTFSPSESSCPTLPPMSSNPGSTKLGGKGRNKNQLAKACKLGTTLGFFAPHLKILLEWHVLVLMHSP